MRMFALAFLIGVCLVQTRAALEGWAVAGTLALGAALVLRLALVRGAARFPSSIGVARAVLTVAIAIAAGVAWSAWRAELRLADELRGELEGADRVVHGRIAGLPQAVDQGWRFVFEPDAGQDGLPRRVLLSWRVRAGNDGEPGVMPQPGERWSFSVRLRRPHGFVNPGGFDYEAWLLERGIRATGYVRTPAIRVDDGPGTPMQRVDRVRAAVRERLLAAMPGREHAGLMVALAVGDQGGIATQDWEVFRRTGVGHLVSISGLHVALVGLLCGGALAMVWRRLPALALRVPAQKAGALAALAGASAYALLAGLGIPVLRAWLMLAVAVWVLFSGRAVAPSRVLAIALLVVLLVDPWAVLSAGFWLSFGAVAIILACVGGRVRVRTGWRGAVRVQLAISVALIPLLLAQFQSFPLLSPLANLVAIPVVSFLITPLVLLALPWPNAVLLVPADVVAGLMMKVLNWLAAWDQALWEQATPPPWLLAGGLVAVAVLLLPRATPGRLAAPALLGGLLAWQPARPLVGGFEAQVLDVGQGLAVHVRTRTHDLLFDAGPPYGSAVDAGSRVILPYLRGAGTHAIDRLVLSHGDVDHIGGAASVIGGVAVGEVLAGQPEALGGATRTSSGRDARWPAATELRPCAGRAAWTWDGVRFEVLHPVAALPSGQGHDNDASCVLRVSGPSGALLLTGDIGVTAEAALLARVQAGALRSEVVVSAHHGSRSSSSPAFVDATLPAHVVHSAGYRNAFGHPHPQVWARWAAAGVRNWRTDAQGAIGMVFAADADEGVTVFAERERRPRYWHGR
jgi:competence protein ComEC